jgi:oligoendopeptidase F
MPVLQALPKRSEVPLEQTWNLETIYNNTSAWEQELEEVKALLPTLATLAGSVGQSASHLLNTLQQDENLWRKLSKLQVYASMRLDEDTTNNFYQGLVSRVTSLAADAASARAFIEPEILQIEATTLQQFIENTPALQLYRHYLNELLRQKEHYRSPEIEALLAQASEVTETASQTFEILNHADLKFPKITAENGEQIEVTHARYVNLMENQQRGIRKQTFEALYSSYERYRNTFATLYAASVKKDVFYAKVRGYKSTLDAALDASHIPVTVYDNLISTVHQYLPVLHRYLDIRKRVLGLDELHMYDLYVPLVPAAHKEIPYTEAIETVKAGLIPLGEEYIQILAEGVKARWIDVAENEGKTSGAYSGGTYDTHPFILLNYTDSLDSMFTLAHELGHSLHSYFTQSHQPYIYSQYTIFVAEVASTCNEALLNEFLLRQTDDKDLRMYLLNDYLEKFRSTLYRQTMFAEFEKLAHAKVEAGEALTAEELCGLYKDLNVKYYGPNIVVDEQIALEWARIPHFYGSFYVYQYATGISAAIALSQQILNEGQPAVERYLKFLKSGNAEYSTDILAKAGVDMTKPEPIEQALQVFSRLLDEFEQLAFS